MIEALLFGGPMDGMTVEIPYSTPVIPVPAGRPIFRDEAGKYIFGHYAYDPERSNHNLVSERVSKMYQPCYKWVRD